MTVDYGIVICNTYSLYTFVWGTNMAAISK